MYNIAVKIFKLLHIKHKQQLIFILLGSLLAMILEILGIGILIPILTVLLVPEESNNIIISLLVDYFNITSNISLLNHVLFLMLIIMLIKSVYLLVFSFFKFRYIAGTTSDVANELFKGYLFSEYSFHIETHSSLLLRNLQIELAEFNSTFQSLMVILTEVIVIIGMISVLIFYEPVGAIITGIFLFLAVYFFQRVIRKALTLWGAERQKLDGSINRTLIQSFGGIKDIKLFGIENIIHSKYYSELIKKINLQTKYVTIKHAPRLYLEFLVMLGLIILIYVLVGNGIDSQRILSTLTIFVGVSFKLVPSFNNVMASVQQVRFSESSINILLRDLRIIRQTKSKILNDNNSDFIFENKIDFINVKFKHNRSNKWIFEKLSFEVKKGAVIGIVGKSGSGKSTLVDLMMGLLNIEGGQIKVDGRDIYRNITGWRKNIGYVPQSIYLTDESIQSNIAFGINSKDICNKSLQTAVNNAQLDKFLKSLDNGLMTTIGESGSKISGGQRQRIGIARALYRNPEILIFDEATSALDIKTEKAIMDSIYSIKNKTIIIIAHRLSTLSKCDFIFDIENGKIKINQV